ncbi:DUF7268 family protein [Halorhabdus amylolytica]|uniref:DUF7268 family protein n=1 Tax=Halorhabdus amylolytica TaxID=2559573 RepID=UPI001B7D7C38|nr:hypothetical protein [Halorhabdus amylolytica]
MTDRPAGDSAARSSTGRDPARDPGRSVRAAARIVLAGIAVGVVVSLALVSIDTPKGATDTAFALGALVFGFGLTTWAGAVGLGETIERMHEYADTTSRWTEAGARRAFATLTWFGSGWLFGAVGTAIALGV